MKLIPILLSALAAGFVPAATATEQPLVKNGDVQVTCWTRR